MQQSECSQQRRISRKMAMSSGCEVRPCLVWTTKYENTSTQFFLRNNMCHLTLSFHSNSDKHTYYSLHIAADREFESNYSAFVSVEHGDVTGLTSSGDFGRSHPSPQTIWEFTTREIEEEFPDHFRSSEPSKFVLSFFSTTPGEDGKAVEPTLSRAQSKNAEMSTQTSLNLKAISCLESLSGDLSKFLDEDSSQDVELKCGDQIVKAHGKFLGTRSRVFAAMLQTDMTEGLTGLVEVRDMDPEVFQYFIRYIYTGKLPPLTIETASRLYEAGDKYELETLTRRCADFLKQNLSPANACDLLVLADAHSDLNFKEYVVAYILDNKIPLQDDRWRAFCDSHPRLANEVLNRFYKMQNEIHQPSKN